MKYLYLIPEEVRNAKLVRDELADVAKSGASNGVYLAWNLAVLVIGGALGYFGSGFVDDNLLNAVIAFDGVIMGFVITAMLFSGRSQFVSKMSYEQTALYAHKTRYMLMSQMNTLFSFLMCLLFCVLTMVASKAKAQGLLPSSVVTVLVVMSSAFFALGCYRVLLLPFQIYDVHSFALSNLVADSKEDVSKDIKAKTEDRLRLLR
ncbi:hypothetical protein [Pseudomonas mosselii]|uniref:hypothetical protein n=1 Tax=Pseudomonas mosselii TaxID=78327 RepID=UPI0021A397BA|nr:hypothetical protein [Pseudomonas mosselii]UWS68394.1 hypothetical protein N0U38_06255 [Pseudomonas mosselii]